MSFNTRNSLFQYIWKKYITTSGCSGCEFVRSFFRDSCLIFFTIHYWRRTSRTSACSISNKDTHDFHFRSGLNNISPKLISIMFVQFYSSLQRTNKIFALYWCQINAARSCPPAIYILLSRMDRSQSSWAVFISVVLALRRFFLSCLPTSPSLLNFCLLVTGSYQFL